MTQSFFTFLFLLLAGHALADFPLQGDFVSKGKNRNTDIGKIFWPYCLPAHGLIHGGVVFLITGSLVMAIAETILHALIDFHKCEENINLLEDQFLHIACKIIWAFSAVYWGTHGCV